MEIGNMVFGNSRGEFAVPRGAGYEEAIYELIQRLECDESPLGNLYVRAFANDVFAVNPYYWGDCTCGYETREAEWDDANPHAESCYQGDLHREKEAMETRIGYCDPVTVADAFTVESLDGDGSMFSVTPKRLNTQEPYDLRQREMDKIYRSLCERHGIAWNNGYGCAVHCDCGHDKKWAEWVATNEHKEDCPIVLPNFHHKASGYKLKWYKYPLRDSYANAEVTAAQFREMIDECMASLATAKA